MGILLTTCYLYLLPEPNRRRACLCSPDPDGAVAKVEFFRGQFKLAEFTTPPPRNRPFRTTFDTDVLGSYELRAVATDKAPVINKGSK